MSCDGSFAPGLELGKILAGEKHSPVVYFVWCAGAVKIGTTTRLLARVTALYVRMTDLIMVVPGGRSVERDFHERLRDHRIPEPGRQELFELDAVLRELSISWERPPVSRLDFKRNLIVLPVRSKPVSGAKSLPPVTLACRYGHSFATRARGDSTVACPVCRKGGGLRVAVHVPVGRPTVPDELPAHGEVL